jgi:NADPH:quinone reductase-like Zn-dependent oxidoreductase
MKAIRVYAYGGAEALRFDDAPIPDLGPQDVLVKVAAAGVNPVDWKVREGYLQTFLPHQLPLVPGWDVSGTVERVGALVQRFRVGDAVYGRPDIARDGSYAEYMAVRAHELAHAPTRIPLAHAAAIPLATLTAWECLFDRADLRAGQTVLIHAGSGGVGTFALQLAKIVGARVITTTSAANADLVTSLGADDVIDYRRVDFSEHVHNVDVVLDTIGGDTQTNSWRVLRKGGILVSIITPPSEDLARQHQARAGYVFVTPNGARLEDVAKLVDAGRLRVVLDKEFPLAQVADAHALSQSGRARGKIILRVH